MESEDLVSLKTLADLLKLDRSNTRKYVKKLGIVPRKSRTPDSGNQLTLVVTRDEADRIVGDRDAKGFLRSDKIVESETGVFYVIQLIPEFDPKRIKLGFALDLRERLAQHRTAAPTAKALKSWPCRRVWESTVIDCLASRNCRHIANEVFECDDLEGLLCLGDQLFSLLPAPTWKSDLSEHSPYRRKAEQ